MNVQKFSTLRVKKKLTFYVFSLQKFSVEESETVVIPNLEELDETTTHRMYLASKYALDPESNPSVMIFTENKSGLNRRHKEEVLSLSNLCRDIVSYVYVLFLCALCYQSLYNRPKCKLYRLESGNIIWPSE